MGGSGSKGDGLASQPRRYWVPGQPLLNWHQVGGVSRSPDGLFAQQEREPIRGRPAVRGKRTYGGRPGQRVEEQGTWASRTPKHSEAGYGRPVVTLSQGRAQRSSARTGPAGQEGNGCTAGFREGGGVASKLWGPCGRAGGVWW